MVFLFLIYIYSHCLSFEIYYNNILSLFPYQYCFCYNFKYIIISFKSVKCAHCVEFNKKYINIFWELLDKVYKDIASQIKLIFNKLECAQAKISQLYKIIKLIKKWATRRGLYLCKEMA